MLNRLISIYDGAADDLATLVSDTLTAAWNILLIVTCFALWAVGTVATLGGLFLGFILLAGL